MPTVLKRGDYAHCARPDHAHCARYDHAQHDVLDVYPDNPVFTPD